MILRNVEPPAIIWQIREGISLESCTIQEILEDAKQHTRQPVSRSWQNYLKDNVQEVERQHTYRRVFAWSST